MKERSEAKPDKAPEGTGDREAERVPPARSGPTKDALLDATERVLLDKGVAGVSTRNISREAGVNQALIHYYFGSVEQMLIAVLERIIAQERERARAICASEQPFLSRWRSSVEWALDPTRPQWPKIWIELTTLAANHPQMYGMLSAHVAEIRKMYMIEALHSLEEFEGMSSTPETALVLVTLLGALSTGLMMNNLLGGDSKYTSLALDLVVSLLEKQETPPVTVSLA